MTTSRHLLVPFAPSVRRQQGRALLGEIAAAAAIAISPQRIAKGLGRDVELPALAFLDDHHTADGLPDAEEAGARARSDGAQEIPVDLHERLDVDASYDEAAGAH